MVGERLVPYRYIVGWDAIVRFSPRPALKKESLINDRMWERHRRGGLLLIAPESPGAGGLNKEFI
jgi:hypothetical protein